MQNDDSEDHFLRMLDEIGNEATVARYPDRNAPDIYNSKENLKICKQSLLSILNEIIHSSQYAQTGKDIQEMNTVIRDLLALK